MKRVLLSTMLLAFIGLGLFSCKEGNKNETEAKDAKEAKEMSNSDEAMTFMVMPEESSIKWSGEKAVGGGHNGVISLKEGKFQMKGGKIESGMAVIDMTSIEDKDLEGDKKQQLEAHLMGTAEGKETDFFNVEEYPTATFEVTGFEKKDGKGMLSGNLKLKDQTKNITFPVSLSMGNNNEMAKMVSEPFTIDRTNWGVKYGSGSVFDDLAKDNVISDDIELELMLKMKRK